jgi:thiol-disulfide isomerase/thioredoxin
MMRVVMLLAGLMWAGCASAPRSAQHPMLHQPVSLSLPADDGSLVSVPGGSSTYVLDFWAPSCEPCRTATPALVARKAELQARGARLILVGVLEDEESTEQGRAVLESWGVRERFLVDRDNASKSQLGVSSLPATLIVDRTGKLVWVAPAGATADEVVAAVP